MEHPIDKYDPTPEELEAIHALYHELIACIVTGYHYAAFAKNAITGKYDMLFCRNGGGAAYPLAVMDWAKNLGEVYPDGPACSVKIDVPPMMIGDRGGLTDMGGEQVN